MEYRRLTLNHDRLLPIFIYSPKNYNWTQRLIRTTTITSIIHHIMFISYVFYTRTILNNPELVLQIVILYFSSTSLNIYHFLFMHKLFISTTSQFLIVHSVYWYRPTWPVFIANHRILPYTIYNSIFLFVVQAAAAKSHFNIYLLNSHGNNIL